MHCACHRSYLDSAAEEIGDQLQENGVVTVAELAKTYDLPGDFISQVAACVLNHEQINVKNCRFNVSVTMTLIKRRKRQKFVYCIFAC